MNAIVCEEPSTIGRAASNWCRQKFKKFGATSIFVPAGKTPIPLYEDWERTRPDFLHRARLLQIDEILTGKRKGEFKNFFSQHLPSYLNQIELISSADEIADLAILGLGLNGHVAFHEPGLAPQFVGGCVSLSKPTCDYLQLEPTTWGLTYGVGTFIQAKAILMIVTGGSKNSILTRLTNRDPELPATHLMTHQDFTLVCDREAWPHSEIPVTASA